MTDPRITELMNLVLDGVATPSQHAQLEAHLSRHPDDRSHYEALSRVVRRLDSQPMTDPPAGLEPRILDAVARAPRGAAEAPAPGSAERGYSNRIKDFLASPRPRLWSTFGLGLAAGVFLFAAIQYGRPGAWDIARDIDPTQVSGTMMASPGREPAGSIPVEAPSGAVSGSAVVYQAEAGILVDVTLQSTVPVEWVLEFDDQAWSLARVEKKGDATSAFAANRGSIRGLHTGEGGVRVTFSGSVDGMQSVVFKVFQGGEPVFEGTPVPTP
jgi:anti-sigma factor RsiW